MISRTDDPFRRIIPGNSSVKTNYPNSSSGGMIRLFARIYTQTNYQTNYRSLPKFVPDRWPVSSINWAIHMNRTHRSYLARSRSHYPREFSKRSFISTVRPSVHTTPSRKNGAFRKRSSNRRNLETPAVRFRVVWTKTFWNRDFFEKCEDHDIHDFPGRVFLKHKSKMAGAWTNLVPRASFPLTSGRKTRALGASIFK